MAESGHRPQRGLFAKAAALVAAALLAGCQTIVPRTAPPAPPPPPTAAPAPARPVSSAIPEDTERHRVALLVPLSGENAGVGRSLANATQLALLDTRNEQVRITSYDTATGAEAAARRAIADGNRLILGPLLSEDVRAVAPVARAARVPVLSFSNDTGVAGDGAFVMGYSPAQSIERVIDHARRSGLAQFAALVPRGLYGERASNAFLRAVEGAGGRAVSIQTYDRSPGAVAAAVGRIPKNAPYQAILIADSAGTASLAVPIVRRSGGAGARVLGTELWNADSRVGASPALNGAWFASVPNALYRQYATKYRTRFGAAPYRLSSMGYDAVLLTVRVARDWRVGDVFPAARLVDPDGFAGLDGAFRFGRDGVAERALEVQEIRGGATVTVSPAPQQFPQR
jgi:branched-chain amino acid transport system substrate-binding protein